MSELPKPQPKISLLDSFLKICTFHTVGILPPSLSVDKIGDKNVGQPEFSIKSVQKMP